MTTETKRPIHYRSTVNGVAGRGNVYYGFVQEIPKAEYPSEPRFDEWQHMVDSILGEMGDKYIGGVIERYEVFDDPNDRVLVFTRIPLFAGGGGRTFDD